MKKSTLYIESEVSNVLLATGMPAHLQGFHFLKDAIMDVVKNPTHLHQLTKKLYPYIADRFSVTSPIVERSMRHAIEMAKKNGLTYNINKMLNTTYLTTDERPCNGNFIGLVSEIVKKNMYRLMARAQDIEDIDDVPGFIKDLLEDLGETPTSVA